MMDVKTDESKIKAWAATASLPALFTELQRLSALPMYEDNNLEKVAAVKDAILARQW